MIFYIFLWIVQFGIVNDRGIESIVYFESNDLNKAESGSVLSVVWANWGERGLVEFKTASNWIKLHRIILTPASVWKIFHADTALEFPRLNIFPLMLICFVLWSYCGRGPPGYTSCSGVICCAGPCDLNKAARGYQQFVLEPSPSGWLLLRKL